MGPNDVLPPGIFSFVDMLAEGTDISGIDVIEINVHSHVRLVFVHLGTNSAHPTSSLHLFKILAVQVTIWKS